MVELRTAVEKFKILGHCYTPGRVKGRLNGPRVFANSFPKSGTNLLSKCLYLFPNLRPSGRFPRLRVPGRQVHMNSNRREDTRELRRKISAAKKGQYTTGHVFCTDENRRIIEESGVKPLLIVRDPRDVVVSHFHWVSEKHPGHRLHDYYRSLPDDHERLMASIRGVNGNHAEDGNELEGIAEWMEQFWRWERQDYNLTVRFENLIGPDGGGDRERQEEEVRRISEHLDADLSEQDVEHVADNIFDTDSQTFRKGVIGDWENQFDPEHREVFKEEAGELLVEMGYADDMTW